MLIFGIYLVIDNTHEFMSAVYMWVLTEAKKTALESKDAGNQDPVRCNISACS